LCTDGSVISFYINLPGAYSSSKPIPQSISLLHPFSLGVGCVYACKYDILAELCQVSAVKTDVPPSCDTTGSDFSSDVRG